VGAVTEDDRKLWGGRPGKWTEVSDDEFATMAHGALTPFRVDRLLTVLCSLRWSATRALVMTKRWRDRLVAMRERITTLEKQVEALQQRVDDNELVLVECLARVAPGPATDPHETGAEFRSRLAAELNRP